MIYNLLFLWQINYILLKIKALKVKKKFNNKILKNKLVSCIPYLNKILKKIKEGYL